MQSRNELGQIVDTQRINDINNKEEIEKISAFAKSKGAVEHVIGTMPSKGQRFILGNLEYEVLSVSVRQGTIHAKLVGL